MIAKLATLLALLFVVSLPVGCGCKQLRNPPETMVAGLLGYMTNTELVPVLKQKGAADLKCVLGPVGNKSAYSASSALQSLCEDIFETDLVEQGYQVAAKEAVEAVARSVGIRDLTELFDDAKLKLFLDKIQQDGNTIADYIFLARVTGTKPDLSIQGKLVYTRVGADFGQQIPKRSEIEMGWVKLWEKYCEDKTSTGWKKAILKEQG